MMLHLTGDLVWKYRYEVTLLYCTACCNVLYCILRSIVSMSSCSTSLGTLVPRSLERAKYLELDVGMFSSLKNCSIYCNNAD
jgi:hypothetical protein